MRCDVVPLYGVGSLWGLVLAFPRYQLFQLERGVISLPRKGISL